VGIVRAYKNPQTGFDTRSGRRVLGGEIVMEGQPTIVQLANSWVIINVGGGPTDDKPEVVLDTPSDLNRVSAFLNIRVADIQRSTGIGAGRVRSS